MENRGCRIGEQRYADICHIGIRCLARNDYRMSQAEDLCAFTSSIFIGWQLIYRRYSNL